MRRRVGAALAALLTVTAVWLAFDLGHSTSASGAGLKPALDGSGENLYNGKRGGTLTVYSAEDFLAPGSGRGVLRPGLHGRCTTMQMPLYMYLPNTGTKLSPILASGMPVLSNGGLTVTVHIKSDVHFSAPVNRAVTSADVAYAIERGANPNVGNAYFAPYFGDIVGAAKATGGPISGIQTPNATTIVFHLTKPVDALFEGALSLPLTMPVPKSFAAPLDAKKPTQYGTSQEVFTGPYMLKSDATGKFLGIGYNPGKNATLVRNPNWNPASDPLVPAYLNQINVNIGGAAQVIGLQVLKGSDSVQADTPPNSIVELAYKSYYNQLVAVPGAGDHYVALNTQHGVFKNVWVRRAAYAALNREAMLKAAGGVDRRSGRHALHLSGQRRVHASPAAMPGRSTRGTSTPRATSRSPSPT